MIPWGGKNSGEFLSSPHSGRAAIAIHSVVDELPGQSGIALLGALIITTSLSLLALSLALLTDSLIRLSKTARDRTQAYYAAQAGLEEARGRLYGSAADAISPSLLPQNVNDVLYIVNSSASDPVNPTDPTSPYFDYEYAQEFTSGFSGAKLLGTVASDQPGAATALAIPYKWVRITLKTEYASKQDVNQDGILNSTVAVYSNGTNQDLATSMPSSAAPVYNLTALAVVPSGVRKLAQAEVAPPPPLTPVASLGTGTGAELEPKGGSSKFIVSGMDACGLQNIPGVAAGGSISVDKPATVSGSPVALLPNLSLFPQSAASLIQTWKGIAVPILQADPTHVTFSPSTNSYIGTGVVLGQQPTGTQPAQPLVVYSDKSLAISGPTSTGEGLLLVNGDVSLTDFNYRGLILAAGTAKLTSSSGTLSIQGAAISSHSMTAVMSGGSTQLTVNYNSCAIAEVFRSLPKTILASRELSF